MDTASAFLNKMFDVGDLPVGLLAFGNCVLKVGVIRPTLPLTLTFSIFFQNPEKHEFLGFLSCCTRFLEH